jgi:hypothetical protein
MLMYPQMLTGGFCRNGAWAKHHRVCFVHGGLSLSERQAYVDAFQQKENSKAQLESDIIVGPVNIIGTGVT